MPRFAANLSMLFTERPFLERFEAAAAAGFEAVEFLFPYEHPAEAIRERLLRHRLQLVLHNLPPGDWEAGERGLACLPDRVAEFRDGVGLGIAYAQALGCRQLHCMAGKAPAGADPALLQHTLVENLRHAAAQARQAGLRLLVEPINPYDIPGYVLNRSAQAVALMDAVAADGVTDNLFLQYDVYHMQRSEGELAATIERLLPRIAHVQIADNPGRHEPGSGEIAYGYLFALLDRLGYAGHVGCEYRPAAGTEAGLGWFHRATRRA
ncbi:2-oxo-tetronate isomerase [Piscinibacter sakaiensis]|uniref:Hydroxypyruvate isomerase n=1 Tax=Piscinibacter sakaiensis TaxID=1547922 RepID=A0A0K8NZ42_PISS1|nr:2-oxo-tetronate isomerase [Piscinibacter sakaiensis]GAP35185.1 hydroxypyruvate isomerase [Piscinibacter sakaiensis]